MKSISMVIRCLNEEEHIGRLLAGIGRQTLQPLEIIIVDSGSTDATLEIASRFPVRVLSIEPELFSFGRSLNLGCEAALGNIIVIASAHVYPVYETWLEELVAGLDDPEVALAYGRQQGDASTRYSEQQIMQKWFPARSSARQEHPFCNNANAAVRKEVWQRFPYNEGLTGLEDLDWAKRVVDSGYHISYVAEAPVTHVHRESWRQIINRYRREAIAQKRIYNEASIGLTATIALAGLNIGMDYYHAAHERVLFRNLAAIPAFRSAQFWGTYRGFAQRGPVPSLLKRRFYYPNGWRHTASTIPRPQKRRRIDYAASADATTGLGEIQPPDSEDLAA